MNRLIVAARIAASPRSLARLALACVVFSSVATAAPDEPKWPELKLKVDPAWPTLPTGWTFEETAGIAVDAREHVFVFHRGPNPLMEFDASGKFVRAWGSANYVRPHGLKFDREGNLWAVDDGGHVVVRLDRDGRVRMVLGRKTFSGETDENFNRPTDIAFAPNGDMYVTDGYGNSRVVQFTADGRFVRAWGRKGKAPGEFNLPHSVAVDRNGRVFIGDRDNFRVQLFTSDGKFLTEWTHVGSPWGLFITPDERVFLCDGYANRILQLTLDGTVIGALTAPGKLPGQLTFAHHLAVGASGNVYVTEIKNWRAQKFTPR